MNFEDLCKKTPVVPIGNSRFFYDDGVYVSSKQKTSGSQKQTEELLGLSGKKKIHLTVMQVQNVCESGFLKGIMILKIGFL